MISVGRGVGGALMLHGVLHAGAGGPAVESGCLPIEPEGPDCACGNRGCVEAPGPPGPSPSPCGTSPTSVPVAAAPLP
ncbi:ROK family protein [Kitasatospora sp. NPDC050467]|uniref:ROK family protein n=1 Tax=unclassified Kitasatospora TaxID=2633591 RepID=UPI0037998CE6